MPRKPLKRVWGGPYKSRAEMMRQHRKKQKRDDRMPRRRDVYVALVRAYRSGHRGVRLTWDEVADLCDDTAVIDAAASVTDECVCDILDGNTCLKCRGEDKW